MGRHTHNDAVSVEGVRVFRVGQGVGLAEARKRFGGPAVPVMDVSR